MKINMYSILDKAAGDFSPPWMSKNDLTAQREFLAVTSKFPHSAADMQLFKVGAFNDEYPASFENDFAPVELNFKEE